MHRSVHIELFHFLNCRFGMSLMPLFPSLPCPYLSDFYLSDRFITSLSNFSHSLLYTSISRHDRVLSALSRVSLLSADPQRIQKLTIIKSGYNRYNLAFIFNYRHAFLTLTVAWSLILYTLPYYDCFVELLRSSSLDGKCTF